MPLTLAQLVAPKTPAAMQQVVLSYLQGLGVVTKSGSGSGSVTVSGTPSLAATMVLKIAITGEAGTAQLQVSTDGGNSFGAAQLVPSTGIFPIAGTGVTATLTAGPVGAGTSFVAGDIFTFAVSIPTFATSSWQPGSVPLAFTMMEANILADLTSTLAAIARGGYVSNQPGVSGASGPWLDLVGQAVYSLTRNAAVTAVVNVVLTAAAGAGPYTIQPGQLTVAQTASLATTSPLRYVNMGGGTIPQGGILTLSFQAESPGAAYNVADASITSLLTSLPGVTVSNAGPGSVTTSGVDVESDIAYATRCLGKWSTLGTGSPAAAYDTWARTASAEVTRTKVQADSTFAFQVDLWVGGSAGSVSGIAAPVIGACTAGAGTLTAGLKYYRVTAIDAAGESLPSQEVSFNAALNTGVNVNWTASANATGYRVYGRAQGAEQLMATVGAVTTWLDNGSVVTPSGALPTANTGGGAIQAVQSYIAARMPLEVILSLQNVTTVSIAVAGTVNIPAGQLSAGQAAALANLATLVQQIAMGGTVYYSQVVEILMLQVAQIIGGASYAATLARNLASLTIGGGTADVVLGASNVPVFTTGSLVFTGV